MKTKIAVGMSSSASYSYPKSMENEALEERLTKRKKQVFITVYVESESSPLVHGVKKMKINKAEPILISKSHARFYDRRAQLLAYAQELRRNTDAKLQEWPENCSSPKPKEKSRTSLEPKSSTRLRSRKIYHRLVPEVDISGRPKSIVLRMKKRKNKANRLNSFRFVVKLRRIFRGLCKE